MPKVQNNDALLAHRKKELMPFIRHKVICPGKRVFHMSYSPPGEKARSFFFGNFGEDGVISFDGEFVKLADKTTNNNISNTHRGIKIHPDIRPFRTANPSNFCETILSVLKKTKATKSGFANLWHKNKVLGDWRRDLNTMAGRVVMPLKNSGRKKGSTTSTLRTPNKKEVGTTKPLVNRTVKKPPKKEKAKGPMRSALKGKGESKRAVERKALQDVSKYGPIVDKVLESGDEREKIELEYEMKMLLLKLEHTLANPMHAKSYEGKADGMAKCFESSKGPDTLEDEDQNDCSKAQCPVDPIPFSCEGKGGVRSDFFTKLEVRCLQNDEPLDCALDSFDLDSTLALIDGLPLS